MKGSESYISLGSHVSPDDTVKTNLWPRPAQSKLPIWGAAGSDQSVIAAAQRGLNLFVGLTTNPDAGTLATPTVEQTQRNAALFIETAQANGFDSTMANIGVLCVTMVADTDEEAYQLVEDGLVNYLEGLVRTFVRSGALRLDSEAAQNDPRSKMMIDALSSPEGLRRLMIGTAQSFAKSPFALVGSVDTVRARLEELRSIGLSRFILALGLGVEHNAAWDAAKAFATDVAPELFAPTADLAASARF
jgi:alkanesulfonate monooxygenase SsuD/methylene tetrahydromethanopterin reductase-like flavin-dependent oxidoreductase (luciferase family)